MVLCIGQGESENKRTVILGFLVCNGFFQARQLRRPQEVCIPRCAVSSDPALLLGMFARVQGAVSFVWVTLDVEGSMGKLLVQSQELANLVMAARCHFAQKASWTSVRSDIDEKLRGPVHTSVLPVRAELWQPKFGLDVEKALVKAWETINTEYSIGEARHTQRQGHGVAPSRRWWSSPLSFAPPASESVGRWLNSRTPEHLPASCWS